MLKEAIVFFLGAFPIYEVRGAIPAGLGFGFSLTKTLTLSILGNFLPVIPVLYFLVAVSTWLRKRFKFWDKFFDWLFARTRRHSESVEKYGWIGLAIFVGVPLPMTGAWSGVAAAFIFGIPFWRAVFAITLGIFMAAAIVTGVCLGFLKGLAIFSLFVK